MKIEKLHQVAVLSRDLNETRTFYEESLGARLLAYFKGPPGLLFFDFFGTRILFERAAPSATIYFWVDDINAAHEELKAKGIEFTHEPRAIFRDDQGIFGESGHEEWMAFFKDRPVIPWLWPRSVRRDRSGCCVGAVRFCELTVPGGQYHRINPCHS